MKLHIICVAYERPIRLRCLIDSFMVQSNPNWELNLVHDGPASKAELDTISLYKKEDRVNWFISEQRYGEYGHPNRRAMLKMIKGNKDDYVLITNDDNYYVPKFIEYFFEVAAPDVGIIYCDTIHSHAGYNINFSQLKEHRIDMGAFIVKLDIAQEVGFKHNHFSADGTYCEECNQRRADKGLRVVYIPKCLFIHN
jgi:hypothetical protein